MDASLKNTTGSPTYFLPFIENQHGFTSSINVCNVCGTGTTCADVLPNVVSSLPPPPDLVDTTCQLRATADGAAFPLSSVITHEYRFSSLDLTVVSELARADGAYGAGVLPVMVTVVSGRGNVAGDVKVKVVGKVDGSTVHSENVTTGSLFTIDATKYAGKNLELTATITGNSNAVRNLTTKVTAHIINYQFDTMVVSTPDYARYGFPVPVFVSLRTPRAIATTAAATFTLSCPGNGATATVSQTMNLVDLNEKVLEPFTTANFWSQFAYTAANDVACSLAVAVAVPGAAPLRYTTPLRLTSWVDGYVNNHVAAGEVAIFDTVDAGRVFVYPMRYTTSSDASTGSIARTSPGSHPNHTFYIQTYSETSDNRVVHQLDGNNEHAIRYAIDGSGWESLIITKDTYSNAAANVLIHVHKSGVYHIYFRGNDKGGRRATMQFEGAARLGNGIGDGCGWSDCCGTGDRPDRNWENQSQRYYLVAGHTYRAMVRTYMGCGGLGKSNEMRLYVRNISNQNAYNKGEVTVTSYRFGDTKTTHVDSTTAAYPDWVATEVAGLPKEGGYHAFSGATEWPKNALFGDYYNGIMTRHPYTPQPLYRPTVTVAATSTLADGTLRPIANQLVVATVTPLLSGHLHETFGNTVYTFNGAGCEVQAIPNGWVQANSVTQIVLKTRETDYTRECTVDVTHTLQTILPVKYTHNAHIHPVSTNVTNITSDVYLLPVIDQTNPNPYQYFGNNISVNYFTATIGLSGRFSLPTLAPGTGTGSQTIATDLNCGQADRDGTLTGPMAPVSSLSSPTNQTSVFTRHADRHLLFACDVSINDADTVLGRTEGFYMPPVGAEPGYYYRNGTPQSWTDLPVICPAGSYCVGGTAQPAPCQPGSNSGTEISSQQAGASRCTVAAGYYIDEGADWHANAEVKKCAKGYTCTGGTSVPKACKDELYAPDEGLSACKTCPTTSYTTGLDVDNANTACTTCEAGYTCNGTRTKGTCTGIDYSLGGAATCTQCLNGLLQFTDGNGVGCVECPIGEYMETPGNTECTPCAAGTYNNIVGATSCKPCPAPGYSNEGATSCSECGIAYRLTVVDGLGTACTSCPAGTYATGAAVDECTPCPAGTYGENTAATACTTCPDHTYNPSTGRPSQMACYACQSTKTYASPDRSQCITCDAGHLVNTDATGCTPCPAGTAETTTGQCVACPDGTYSTPGQDTCTSCPANTHSYANHTTCSPDAGYYADGSPTDNANIKECQMGYECLGDNIVRPCTGNTYADELATAECKTCPGGSYTTGDSGSAINFNCQFCPTGRICDGTRLVTTCNSGHFAANTDDQYVPEGAVKCLGCTVGNYCVDGVLESCEAGNYTSDGRNHVSTLATACTTCDAGYKCPGGGDIIACKLADYQNLTGQTECKQCLVGSIVTSHDGPNISCTPCSAGDYSDTAGATTCTACPAETYNPFTGVDSLTGCLDCSANNEFVTSDRSKCVTCKPGFFPNTEGTDCVKCEQGYWDNGDLCTQCTDNNYVPEDALSCIPCPANTTANDNHTTCTANPGYYSTGPAHIEENVYPCEAGYRCPGGGERFACTDRKNGLSEYQDEDVMDECKTCAVDHYTNYTEPDATANTSCNPCPLGHRCFGDRVHAVCDESTFAANADGQYVTENGVQCVECPAGHACSAGVLTLCPPGTYTSTALSGGYIELGAVVCSTCMAGHACPGVGTITACDANTYTAKDDAVVADGADRCVLCPAGTACDGTGTMTACTIGTYAEFSSGKCIDCTIAGYYTANDTHQYTSVSASQCLTCNNTYVCTGAGAAPAQCAEGQYTADSTGGWAETAASECRSCPKGKRCDATNIYDCQAGEFAANETDAYVEHSAVKCLECTAGNYCMEGLLTSCNAGNYTSDGETYAQTGATDCTTCPIGHECSGDGTVIECTDTTYQPNTGRNACWTCPDHSSSDNARTTCLVDPGYYISSGTFVEYNAIVDACKAGHKCNDGQIEACDGHDYQPHMTSSTCWTCPTNTTVNTAHTICDVNAGFYVVDGALGTNNAVIDSCQIGHSCLNGVATECPVNMYQDTRGQPECKNCPENTTSGPRIDETTTAASVCTVKAGHYIEYSTPDPAPTPDPTLTLNTEPTYQVVECPAGSFCLGGPHPLFSDTVAERVLCNSLGGYVGATSYQPAKGQSECLRCTGAYARSPNGVSCTKCPDGQVSYFQRYDLCDEANCINPSASSTMTNGCYDLQTSCLHSYNADPATGANDHLRSGTSEIHIGCSFTPPNDPNADPFSETTMNFDVTGFTVWLVCGVRTFGEREASPVPIILTPALGNISTQYQTDQSISLLVIPPTTTVGQSTFDHTWLPPGGDYSPERKYGLTSTLATITATNDLPNRPTGHITYGAQTAALKFTRRSVPTGGLKDSLPTAAGLSFRVMPVSTLARTAVGACKSDIQTVEMPYPVGTIWASTNVAPEPSTEFTIDLAYLSSCEAVCPTMNLSLKLQDMKVVYENTLTSHDGCDVISKSSYCRYTTKITLDSFADRSLVMTASVSGYVSTQNIVTNVEELGKLVLADQAVTGGLTETTLTYCSNMDTTDEDRTPTTACPLKIEEVGGPTGCTGDNKYGRIWKIAVTNPAFAGNCSLDVGVRMVEPVTLSVKKPVTRPVLHLVDATTAVGGQASAGWVEVSNMPPVELAGAAVFTGRCNSGPVYFVTGTVTDGECVVDETTPALSRADITNNEGCALVVLPSVPMSIKSNLAVTIVFSHLLHAQTSNLKMQIVNQDTQTLAVSVSAGLGGAIILVTIIYALARVIRKIVRNAEVKRLLDALQLNTLFGDAIKKIKDIMVDPLQVEVTGPVLGRGGFGTVIRGTFGGAPVAIKKLHSHLIDDPMAVESIVSEAVVQADLRHPHLVGFYGCVALGGTLGLVHEFCGDGSLKGACYNHSFAEVPLARRLEWLRQVASALAYLHSRGIAHRDLKAVNVLLADGSASAKLGDLGLARDANEKEETAGMSMVLGTPAWLSPEAIMNETYDEFAADVYAFGIMAWEVLAGKEPFGDVAVFAIAIKITEDDARPVHEQAWPQAVKTFIDLLWIRDPKLRPTMAKTAIQLATLSQDLQKPIAAQ